MRDPIPRAKQVAHNDARLMDAARKVFMQRGYHAASLDMVAHAAGLTKGAVYARFESKAELMLALLEARIVERTAQMQEIADAGPHTQAELVAALARQWATLSRSEADWSLLVLEFRVHVARDRVLNAKFRALHERLREAIAGVLAGKRGDSTDSLARMSMVVADGLALERAVDPDGLSSSLYETAAAALVKGLT